jgi:hypothetical protein
MVSNGCPFRVGQYVKFYPPYKVFQDLFLISEETGLSPRMIYKIIKILDDGSLVFKEGGPAHWGLFKNGELDHKLGKVDLSWEEEKKREEESKRNFENR